MQHDTQKNSIILLMTVCLERGGNLIKSKTWYNTTCKPFIKLYFRQRAKLSGIAFTLPKNSQAVKTHYFNSQPNAIQVQI
eukprot:c28363_g1_i4 orf=100-339(+)